MQTKEHRLMDEIRLEAGRRGWLAFRMNVGTFYAPDGSHVSTGLPEGFPDLMVVMDGGKVGYIETKVHPRRPTEAQLRVQAALRAHGCPAGTAYTLDEALAILEGL